MKIKFGILFFIINILYSCVMTMCYAQSDTTQKEMIDSTKAVDTTPLKKIKTTYEHQIKIGVDISRIPFNILLKSRQSYEFQADYLLRKDVYINMEAGFGRGKIDFDFLKYTSNSFFVKAGIQQSRVGRISDKDFDVFFIGVNYGIAAGKRNEASYTITSIFGTTTEGSTSPDNFVVHWGEIVAGVRVEFLPRLFAGWNIRGKFLFNANTFKELTPNFIAGYGKGDKSTIFDFNFYLCYALRWNHTNSSEK